MTIDIEDPQAFEAALKAALDALVPTARLKMVSGRFYCPIPGSFAEKEVGLIGSYLSAVPMIIPNDITLASLSIVTSAAADATHQYFRLGVATDDGGIPGDLLFEGDSEGDLANPGGSGEITIAFGDTLPAGRYWGIGFIAESVGGAVGYASARCVPNNLDAGFSSFRSLIPYEIGALVVEVAGEGQLVGMQATTNADYTTYANLAAAYADIGAWATAGEANGVPITYIGVG